MSIAPNKEHYYARMDLAEEASWAAKVASTILEEGESRTPLIGALVLGMSAYRIYEFLRLDFEQLFIALVPDAPLPPLPRELYEDCDYKHDVRRDDEGWEDDQT